jgi:7,8-dihydropterin-6-yl-methyl-4-(beta-D-ribofuranosyl)aminobenzene 5'-phosphate synthase
MVVTRSRAYRVAVLSFLLAAFFDAAGAVAAEGGANTVRVTILYDAFGKTSAMKKGWGYAAFIEYGGKRILFDTGDDPTILAANAKATGVDLSRLDFAVLSHRHSDLMGGLDHLLHVNPRVTIYAPKESFGIYGSSLPGTFYRRDPSLPPEQRYFDGSPPAVMKFGTAWPRARFELVESSREIAPGIHLISLVSEKPGTLELRELSLAIDTPEGLVLLVGCSHPGIEKILDAAGSIHRNVHVVLGGLHLVTSDDTAIAKAVVSLHDTWKVDYIAPGHCTGEPGFAALRNAFGEHYLYAGLGSRLELGATPASESAAKR